MFLFRKILGATTLKLMSVILRSLRLLGTSTDPPTPSELCLAFDSAHCLSHSSFSVAAVVNGSAGPV